MHILWLCMAVSFKVQANKGAAGIYQRGAATVPCHIYTAIYI